ncbi:MAG TPA: type I DNA topoisomerase [Candidatus Sabulitectum sp.]|nr:type I DNA topoisomerase [Candidatus Sabulitectum sp.]
MATRKKRKLLIIESPAKARSLRNYLGSGWDVIASNGHVRDLPLNRIGVNLETLEPTYTVLPGKRSVVAKLRKTAEGYEEIYLAADPDREGEAICWHVSQLLSGGDRKFRRIRFNSITREAVTAASRSAGSMDMDLVDAQQARRVMDRLVGYRVSPYLWRTVGKGLSAGRVQTVALRMIVEREADIRDFIPREYWPITALFHSSEGEFQAKLHRDGGRRADGDRYSPGSGEKARETVERARKASWSIVSVQDREKKRKPSPPFITSSLQVTASSRLSFSPSVTMRLAQELYEGFDIDGETTGLITYMRTDSVRIEPAAIDECRSYIAGRWGKELLEPKPRRYRSSGSAQDAHEAIRPTDVTRTPESLAGKLEPRHLKLYELIWNRFVATQMSDALISESEALVQGGELVFRASGQKMMKKGFTEVDPWQVKLTAEMPALQEGPAELLNVSTEQKFTSPPSRFTEASLVSEMKKRGIGRPSTYVSIIGTLKKRAYVELKEKKLHPTEVGTVTTGLLTDLFPGLFRVEFTAEMEDLLDEIAAGRKTYHQAVDQLYQPLAASLEEAMKKLPGVKASLVKETEEKCPECGRALVEKMGKFGKFLACPGFPSCKYTRPLDTGTEEKIENASCPECGGTLSVRKGRFGRYAACSTGGCGYTGPLPAGVKCPVPQCSGELVERTTRKGKVFFSCSKYPDCDFAMWNRPIDRRCPKCGFPLLEQRKKGVFCPNCRKKID